jgi:peptidoglycan hydrolase-like protein with peptidoglycan-binding domain
MLAICTLLVGGGSLAFAQAKKTPARPAPKARTTKKPVVRRPPAKRAQAGPTHERIVEIQTALADRGFYDGPPSGKWDAATTKAMRDFQTASGLTPTGKLGALSLQKLGLGSEIAGRAAPRPQADSRPSALTERDLDEPEEPQEPEAN